MSRDIVCGSKKSGNIALQVLSLLVVLFMTLPGYLPFLPALLASAQNNPPPFGQGDWVIDTPTVIKDQSLTIRGNITLNSGGSLTLDHSVLIIMSPTDYQYNFTAYNGSAVTIINGSFVGSGDRSNAFLTQEQVKLIVRNSTISNFGAIVTTDFGVVFDNSSIIGNGDSDGLGLGVMGGSVTLRHTNVTGGEKGIWMDQGHLDIIDSTFTDNPTGIYMYWNYPCGAGGYYYWPRWSPDWIKHRIIPPCGNVRFTTIERSSFVRNAGIAIWVEVANLFMNNSQVLWTDYNAIYGEAYYNIDIENTVISHTEGVGIQLMIGGPTVILKNVDVTDCRGYSYMSMDVGSIGIDWSTDKNMRIDSIMKGNALIHAESGGHLTLDSATITDPGTYATSIVADAGGTVDILNSTIGLAGQSTFVSSADGGTLRIRNSTLAGANWAIENEGDLILDNSTLKNSHIGIKVDGGQTTVTNTMIHNCTYGIQGNAGTVKMYNSNIEASSYRDIYLQDGKVDAYDTNFTSVLLATANGVLQVFWSSQVHTMWENGATLGNASVNISEMDGTHVWSGRSGLDGLTPRTYLRQYIMKSGTTTMTTPHGITAKYKGMTNTTTGLVDKQTVLPIYLTDGILPIIKVIYPGLDVHQKNGTLFVNGTAIDNESGLDRVQWSLDEDLWTDAEGLAKWNFTTNLSVGSRDLYVRALDRAGNAANVTIHVTIDNSPPYVYILSPKNNFTTKLLNVLVSGATEAGSSVTIKNQTVVSLDGNFQLSVPIVEGLNVIVVNVKDLTGNTNSTSVRVIRHTIPPKIVITYPPDNLYTNRRDQLNLPVTGFTDPGVKLISLDRLITVNDDGSFSFTYGLTEGLNVISLLAEDSLGNQNTSVRHVTFDITKPTLNITSPKDGLYTNQTKVKITGTTKALTTVTSRSLNFTASTQSDPDGWFEMTMNLSEGPNIIQLMAKDKANNTNTGQLIVFRDTVSPAIKLNDVKDGMVTDQTWLLIEGQTEVGAHVKLNGEIVPVGTTGSFGATLNLTSANNTFIFQATDKAGNTNSLTLHIKRKIPTEPKPGGVAAAMDYMPWIILIVVIVLIVQWAFLARTSQLKAKKKKLDKELESKTKATAEPAQPSPERMQPKRPRRQAPIVVERGAPEFEIEYGGGKDMGPGGGRQ